MKELDELFAEAEPFIKRRVRTSAGEPYGRGKDYNLKAVLTDIAAGFRICTRCKIKKPIEEFSKRVAHVTGYKAWCKECDSERFAVYHYNNKETLQAKDRAKHYRRKYGLSDELSKALADPETRIASCPLCRKTSQLVVDHNHETGVVRGLLCSHCNTMLGYARESIDTLYEAIAYLKKHKGV